MMQVRKFKKCNIKYYISLSIQMQEMLYYTMVCLHVVFPATSGQQSHAFLNPIYGLFAKLNGNKLNQYSDASTFEICFIY